MNNILNNVVTDDEETEDIFGYDIVNIAAPIINAPIKAGNNIFNNIHDAVIMEEDRNHDLYLQPRGDPNACIQNFYEEVIPAYTDQQFYEHFRIHRNVFEELVSIIEGRIAILNANPENNSDNDSGRPGRCHDASVLHSSALYRRLIDPAHPLLSNCQHLLGDSGYPLSTHILTPFRDNGHLSDQETRYNVVHASCRSIIERAFGLLKVKFRRLYHLNVQSVRMANVMIAASCTLHNFNLMHGQANIWDNSNFVNENRDDDDHNDDDIGDDDADGVIKRDRIMEAM
ncbi:unnamed protein product [Parnassius apollo]|uniref:(apollo) hypothetical protein n=1 Tax=Parnassius apollo TaxID=110799 RepID=A0A8S3Y6N8_PARAO|nr:unnamed protein product [Parnassius apollo]